MLTATTSTHIRCPYFIGARVGEGEVGWRGVALLFNYAYTSIYKNACSAMQCDAIQYDAMRCNTMQCNAMRCGAVRCGAVRCDTVRYGALR